MRVIIQRVKSASVFVDGKSVGKIGKGLLLFIAIKRGDTIEDCDYIINKIINLRIFEDANGKMNISLKEKGYDVLIVSEFTLYGDSRKGNRPNFQESAPFEYAEKIYNLFVDKMKKSGINTEAGKFGAMMDVELINDGPVTLITDS